MNFIVKPYVDRRTENFVFQDIGIVLIIPWTAPYSDTVTKISIKNAHLHLH